MGHWSRWPQNSALLVSILGIGGSPSWAMAAMPIIQGITRCYCVTILQYHIIFLSINQSVNQASNQSFNRVDLSIYPSLPYVCIILHLSSSELRAYRAYGMFTSRELPKAFKSCGLAGCTSVTQNWAKLLTGMFLFGPWTLMFHQWRILSKQLWVLLIHGCQSLHMTVNSPTRQDCRFLNQAFSWVIILAAKRRNVWEEFSLRCAAAATGITGFSVPALGIDYWFAEFLLEARTAGSCWGN